MLLSADRPLFYVVRLIFVALLVTCASAQALVVEVDSNFRQINLGPGLEYAKSDLDSPDGYPVDAIHNWKTLRENQINFGFSDSGYWIRFDIENSADQTRDLIMETGNTYLDYIHLYVLDKNNHIVAQAAMGDRVPAIERRIGHPRYLHPIASRPGEAVTVLLHVKSSSALSVPLTLWERNAFIEYDFLRTVSFGIFFGILLMLSLYHLVISLLTRDITLFYYAAFIFGILLIFMLREGVISSMVWLGSGVGTEADNLIAVGIACWGIAFFTSRILQLKNTMLTMDRLLKGLAILTLIPGFFVNTVDYGILIRISLSLVLMLIFLNVIALAQRVWQKYPAAKHLITASSFALIGITTTILTVLGLLPVNETSQATIYGCVTFMGFYYSLSISYRMNMDRALREEAQSKHTHRLDELVREQTEELEKANNQLQTISITDGLTQLFNRRHLDNVLATEYNRAYRESSPLSLLLFDIDHFKQLNDTHGHGFGDECLKTAGKLISAIARRPSDFAARYGGEEFVILLPDTGPEGAFHMARRIRRAFSESEVVDGEHRAVMTVSVGVASEIPAQRDQQDALLKRADQWLYEAKRNGRNRVEGDAVPRESSV